MLTVNGLIADYHSGWLFVGGKVVAVNSRQPVAQAIAVDGNEVVAVGTDAEVRRGIDKETVVVAADGRNIVPGFNDANLDLFRSIRCCSVWERLPLIPRVLPM